MKRLITIILISSLCTTLDAQEKGIQFEKELTWGQIKRKAKSENKYIFMDIYATWCGPCNEMVKDVYPSEKVGAYLSKNFISVKVQLDRTKSDDEHVKNWYADVESISREYKVSILPTFLFFSSDGNLVHKETGYRDIDGLIGMAQSALDPKKQFYTLLSAYKSNKLEPQALPELAKMAKSLGEKVEAQIIADDYINRFLFKLKEETLYKQGNLEFIGQYIGKEGSRSFNFYAKNTDKINEVLGQNKAEYAIRDAISRHYLPNYDTWLETKPNWDSLEVIIRKKFGPLGLEEIYGNRMAYNYQLKNWAEFGKYYVLYFEKALKRPEYQINNFSWPIFEHIDDPKILDFAIRVMKYSLEIWDQTNYQAYDTYANLLHKNGNTSEAIVWEERAVRASKGSPDEKSLAEVLSKMRKGEKTWDGPSNK